MFIVGLVFPDLMTDNLTSLIVRLSHVQSKIVKVGSRQLVFTRKLLCVARFHQLNKVSLLRIVLFEKCVRPTGTHQNL